MRNYKLSALALAAGLLAATPALALSGSTASQADVARVSAEVSTIADATARARAEQKVWQASEALIERNAYHAYLALEEAQAIADRAQVAQQRN